jgi:hypothetical protein
VRMRPSLLTEPFGLEANLRDASLTS